MTLSGPHRSSLSVPRVWHPLRITCLDFASSPDDAQSKQVVRSGNEAPVMGRRIWHQLVGATFHQACRRPLSWGIVVTNLYRRCSPEQRLYKIAQLVGVPAHGLSGSYFDIADGISRLLLLIETGVFTAIPHAVAALYTPSSALEPVMRTIITHWSIITGRDMKAGKFAPMEAARRSA